MDVLEVIDNFLVLDHLGQCLDVDHSISFDFALVHLGLVAYDAGAIHRLEQAWLELVGFVVLSRLESHFGETLYGDVQIHLEGND